MSASADIVVGLGFGDEGKGATVDSLVASREAKRVVRFNGGAQAAHNVIMNSGRDIVHHTFATFGSGTLAGVPTYVSKYCTFDPLAMFNEYKHLHDVGIRNIGLFVDSECLVTTPLHKAANVVRNSRNGHGTTGMGFGETIAYDLFHGNAIRVSDLTGNMSDLIAKLGELRDHYVNTGIIGEDWFDDLYPMAFDMWHQTVLASKIVSHDRLLEDLQTGYTVFEGAQGFFLDQHYGFNPHTTWSKTTPTNAREILSEAGIVDIKTIGVLRTYATRHGAGPLPHEGPIDNSSELHNGSDGIQGVWRTGLHDYDMTKWAIDTVKPDALSVTHLDVVPGFATNQGILGLTDFGVPVMLKSNSPHRNDRVYT